MSTRGGRPAPRRGRPTPHRAPEAPGLAARRGALAILSGVLDRGQMPDEAAPGASSPEIRAEARALADLTFRRLGQIDRALGALVERTPKPPGCHILRLMGAELMFHGTAPHAAVDTAVRLARATKGAERLTGLVNAVGRKLAAMVPEAESDETALANMPRWLMKRLRADWGSAETAAIARAHLLPAPHDLSFAAEGDAAAMAAECGGVLLPWGGLRLDGRPQLTALPGYEAGAWWVQDAAAALPALLMPAKGRVLDLCAAPGGKTMQMAARGLDVTALDLSERRMARLGENLARTGLKARLVTADALDWTPDAPFDGILLDAPCSATGTIRRHPDLPHRKGGGDVAALIDLQARLLDRAWEWLRPGGTLVYATCSLLKAEGEAQAAAFVARSGAERVLVAFEGLPAAAVTEDGDLRTLPSMLPDIGGLDGFFAARFRHPG